MRLIDADKLMKRIEQSRVNNNHKTTLARQVHDAEHYHFLFLVASAETVPCADFQKYDSNQEE